MCLGRTREVPGMYLGSAPVFVPGAGLRPVGGGDPPNHLFARTRTPTSKCPTGEIHPYHPLLCCVCCKGLPHASATKRTATHECKVTHRTDNLRSAGAHQDPDLKMHQGGTGEVPGMSPRSCAWGWATAGPTPESRLGRAPGPDLQIPNGRDPSPHTPPVFCLLQRAAAGLRDEANGHQGMW